MAPFIPLLVAVQPSLCSFRNIPLSLSLSLSLSLKRAHSAAVLFVLVPSFSSLLPRQRRSTFVSF